MSNGHGRAFDTASGSDAPVLRGEVAVFLSAGGPGALVEGALEPAVAVVDSPAAAFACALFVTGTHARPRCQMIRRCKACNVRAQTSRRVKIRQSANRPRPT